MCNYNPALTIKIILKTYCYKYMNTLANSCDPEAESVFRYCQTYSKTLCNVYN